MKKKKAWAFFITHKTNESNNERNSKYERFYSCENIRCQPLSDFKCVCSNFVTNDKPSEKTREENDKNLRKKNLVIDVLSPVQKKF